MSEHDPELDPGPEPDGATDGPPHDSTDGPPDGSADGPTVVEVPTEAGTARLGIPSDADDDEVAALVAAVSSRMVEATAESARDDPANPWRLAARLGVRRRIGLPRACRRGGEWTAAARRP